MMILQSDDLLLLVHSIKIDRSDLKSRTLKKWQKNPEKCNGMHFGESYELAINLPLVEWLRFLVR